MKNLISLAILLFALQQTNAQNLVTDGSLEDSIKCPLSIGRFYHPTNVTQQYTTEWRATTLASPDYHHDCGYSSFMARTGEGYAGILYYDPAEVREYVTALLSSPLIAGERYAIEYWVALSAGSTRAVDELQVHFSTGAPVDAATFPPPGPYALANHWQADYTPTDNAYQKISTCYTATGGEDAMTFGNFMDNANTTITVVGSVGAVNAYYYIDDVSIYLFDSTATATAAATAHANMDGATYQWVDCGTGHSPIAGETAQDFTATTSGSYACIITMGDCVDTSDCIALTVNGGGASIAEDLFSMRISPNPVVDELNLSWSGEMDRIEVRDVGGRLIAEVDVSSVNSHTLDFSNLTKGVYVLSCFDGGGVSSYRVLKE